MLQRGRGIALGILNLEYEAYNKLFCSRFADEEERKQALTNAHCCSEI